jgi:hypothetical protein
MDRWEYRRELDVSVEELNRLGDEGWELVLIIPHPPAEAPPGLIASPLFPIIFVFKRRKPAGSQETSTPPEESQ